MPVIIISEFIIISELIDHTVSVAIIICILAQKIDIKPSTLQALWVSGFNADMIYE
jgi:hypothetical protein